MTFKEPVGVVGLIVPWNFPMPILSWGMAPALAAGCTVVAKPAEMTPLTAMRIGELALAAGLPDGVFQVLPGKGSVVGQRLVDHPLVRKIVFTGSTEVGQRIMAGCARHIKRLTLELGGKSANIVFADADIERLRPPRRTPCSTTPARTAAPAPGSWSSARVLDKFMALLEPAVKGVRVGDPARRRHGDGPADLGRRTGRTWPASCPTTRPWRSAAARRTVLASGTRRPCWRRSAPVTPPTPTRSSGRSSR